uniref:Uncharacterized protein n=1 Tax=Rhizophora mucronata TaxID=61149 RepID=A0A2P2PA44_RHIMU
MINFRPHKCGSLLHWEVLFMVIARITRQLQITITIRIDFPLQNSFIANMSYLAFLICSTPPFTSLVSLLSITQFNINLRILHRGVDNCIRIVRISVH